MAKALNVQPVLDFEGRCEEALEFYKKAVGAEVLGVRRFKDNPHPATHHALPDAQNKVLHAAFRIGDATLFATDGRNSGHQSYDGYALSLHAPDEAEAQRLFGGLSEGGKVLAPLAKTFFAKSFGIATDKFGVKWMVMVQDYA